MKTDSMFRSISNALDKMQVEVHASRKEKIAEPDSWLIDLFSTMAGFDHYYDYSDDASVRRDGDRRLEEICLTIEKSLLTGRIEGSYPEWTDAMKKGEYAIKKLIAEKNPEYYFHIYSASKPEVLARFSEVGRVGMMRDYEQWVSRHLKYAEECQAIANRIDPVLMGFNVAGPELDLDAYRKRAREIKETKGHLPSYLSGITIPKDLQQELNDFVRNRVPEISAHCEHWMMSLVSSFGAVPFTISRSKEEGFSVIRIACGDYGSIRVIEAVL